MTQQDSAELRLELDHVGVAVRDLDAGRDAYERLGFALTPRSFHSGARTPGGPVEPWGSGNHCAMFEDGYLEIIGITDPDRYSSATALLDRYEGAHIVAIGDDDADAAYEILSQRLPGVRPAARLQREAPFGPDGAETRLAAFRNIHLEPDAFPEAKLIFIEHLTRDVLWQPHLLSHPNGVVGLVGAALCVADPAATCARLAALFAQAPEDVMPGVSIFALARGSVYVMDEAGLQGWAPGVAPPCLPWVASFGMIVRDLAATRALLEGNGVTVRDHPYQGIWAAPEDTCGPVVSFFPA